MKKAAIILLFLFILPFVSAYNGWNYWFSPSDLLNNEWVVFALIFAVFFAFSFFALSKTFSNNVGVSAVVSIVISLFIAVSISQRARFYGSSDIGGWLFIIAIVLAFLIFIKFITKLIGGFGLMIVFFAGWYILGKIEPYSIIPEQISSYDFLPLYEFLTSYVFLVILIILTIVFFVIADKNPKFHRWFWAKHEKETYLSKLMKPAPK